MSGFDPSQYFRYSADKILGLPSILGVSNYQSFLVNIVNEQIAFDDTTEGNRVRTDTRILVGDGYETYAPNDGYLNPMLAQKDGSTLVLSNGQLVDNELLLGPLVLPYNVLGGGGFDPTEFQPSKGANHNTQIYVHLFGPGLSSAGNYFEVKEIIIDGMTNISYQVKLIATSKNVF